MKMASTSHIAKIRRASRNGVEEGCLILYSSYDIKLESVLLRGCRFQFRRADLQQ